MASGNYEIYFKVNMTKTKVTTPSKLKYLGFGFWKDKNDGQWKARPHQDSVARFKRKLKKLTSRRWSISMDDRIVISCVDYYLG